MAPIVLLLRTVFEAILEVFLLCLAGYILARRNVLDKRTQKQINRLNVSLFTPSLLFSKVAFSLSPAKLRELWVIPIFFVLVTAVSMCVSYFLGCVLRLKRSQRNFAIAASIFMNSNSLPVALMGSLVVTVPGLKWDDEDTESAMVGRALSYLVLYSTLGMVLRWSYGVHLLSQADPEGSDAENTAPVRGSEEHEGSYRDNPTEGLLIDVNDDTHPTTITSQDQTPSIVFNEYANGTRPAARHSQTELLLPRSHKEKETHRSVFFSFPNTPTQSRVSLPSSSSATLSVPYDGHAGHNPDDSDFDSDSDEALLLPRNQHPKSAPPPSLIRRAGRRVKKALLAVNEFMTVPLWAAALSLIVALTPPLQHALDSHMQPIKGALTAAGNCSIPLTLVVLGAYFYTPSVKEEIKPVPAHADGVANGDGLANGNGAARRDASQQSGRSLSIVGSVRSMLRLSRLDRWEAKGANGAAVAKPEKEKPLPGETRTVLIAVLSRMVLTPLLLLPLMALGARFDIPKVFDDPVFVVSNVLLISSPPALTLAQITQAASGDAFERLISRTIFWAYCIVTPPATIIYVVIGLLFAKM